MNMREERASLLKAALSITDGASKGGRDLTPTEAADVKAKLSRVDEIDTHLERAKESDALMARLSGAASTSTSAKGAGYGWAKSVADSLHEKAGTIGVKALLSGEVATPPAVPVSELPGTPVRLLDLVPRQPLSEHTFSYLRQTVRTNNAAPVADGVEKPTSVYTFAEIEDRARVIAHLSEPFPIRYLSDHESMVEVLGTQMVAGVWEAIEDLIINGDGVTGDEWEGILAVSGTTPVVFATDVVTTLRKARTALEVKGERVTAVAMNPSDVEALDLIREDGTTGGFLLDGTAYEMIFGAGVRGISSTAIPEGTAIVGDWSTLRLRVREDVGTLAATQGGADEDGDLFDTNRVKLRTEGRYGFQIMRPQALAVVELVATP